MKELLGKRAGKITYRGQDSERTDEGKKESLEISLEKGDGMTGQIGEREVLEGTIEEGREAGTVESEKVSRDIEVARCPVPEKAEKKCFSWRTFRDQMKTRMERTDHEYEASMRAIREAEEEEFRKIDKVREEIEERFSDKVIDLDLIEERERLEENHRKEMEEIEQKNRETEAFLAEIKAMLGAVPDAGIGEGKMV